MKVVLLQTESVPPRRIYRLMHYPTWVLEYEPAMLGILGLIFQS